MKIKMHCVCTSNLIMFRGPELFTSDRKSIAFSTVFAVLLEGNFRTPSVKYNYIVSEIYKLNI